MISLATLIGLLAAFLTTASYVPQLKIMLEHRLRGGSVTQDVCNSRCRYRPVARLWFYAK